MSENVLDLTDYKHICLLCSLAASHQYSKSPLLSVIRWWHGHTEATHVS